MRAPVCMASQRFRTLVMEAVRSWLRWAVGTVDASPGDTPADRRSRLCRGVGCRCYRVWRRGCWLAFGMGLCSAHSGSVALAARRVGVLCFTGTCRDLIPLRWPGFGRTACRAALGSQPLWHEWPVPGCGVSLSTRRPACMHGTLARRSDPQSAKHVKFVDYLLLPGVRHGIWALESWAEALARRGHGVHVLTLPHVGEDLARDESLLASAVEAIATPSVAGFPRSRAARHCVVLGHGVAAAVVGRLLAHSCSGLKTPASAAVLVSPPAASHGEVGHAFAAMSAAATHPGLCRRLLFSAGAAEGDVEHCMQQLRRGRPIPIVSGADALPYHVAESEAAGALLSDRILVIGGDADALTSPDALQQVSDIFRAGDAIFIEGAGHSLMLDRRFERDAAKVILDWTQLLFTCGYLQ